MWSVDKFLNYVGLDQAAVEPSSEDTCGINRSLVCYDFSKLTCILILSEYSPMPMLYYIEVTFSLNYFHNLGYVHDLLNFL